VCVRGEEFPLENPRGGRGEEGSGRKKAKAPSWLIEEKLRKKKGKKKKTTPPKVPCALDRKGNSFLPGEKKQKNEKCSHSRGRKGKRYGPHLPEPAKTTIFTRGGKKARVPRKGGRPPATGLFRKLWGRKDERKKKKEAVAPNRGKKKESQ